MRKPKRVTQRAVVEEAIKRYNAEGGRAELKIFDLPVPDKFGRDSAYAYVKAETARELVLSVATAAVKLVHSHKDTVSDLGFIEFGEVDGKHVVTIGLVMELRQ